uniref:Uncharacterized protein n=1 Tax=Romanomermis culicivorax TaxID=13658 RepID=A0A915HM23_ROMCU
ISAKDIQCQQLQAPLTSSDHTAEGATTEGGFAGGLPNGPWDHQPSLTGITNYHRHAAQPSPQQTIARMRTPFFEGPLCHMLLNFYNNT